MIQGHDQNLANEARKVSDSCKMDHITASDSRWGEVGQNMYMSQSSENTPGQNWTAAIDSWYQEYSLNPTASGAMTGSYTQLVWHNSNTLGCDYIYFRDPNNLREPYTKLYTCNYGPGGNIVGQAPYERA